jgi:hypothetical protein
VNDTKEHVISSSSSITRTIISLSANLVSYASPSVDSVHGCDSNGVDAVNCPRQGGSTIILTGNFGFNIPQVSSYLECQYIEKSHNIYTYIH